ncbi:MAG: hypothetical protein PGN37_19890, partial [Mycobacterium kyogaense]|uniref:hypothetical protein n=1 Tax=Mycobacterium kyogaense TaxID=2212479 RepID=UPI002FFADD94
SPRRGRSHRKPRGAAAEGGRADYDDAIAVIGLGAPAAGDDGNLEGSGPVLAVPHRGPLRGA